MAHDLPLTFSGTVIRFKGDGRKLGYPTANIRINTDVKDGVYFGFADLNEYHNHPAIIFIGTPTTMGEQERRLEAHLLDIPDKDYHGLLISVRAIKYHRPNQTFNKVNELLKVMRQDEAAARAWFSSSGSGRL